MTVKTGPAKTGPARPLVMAMVSIRHCDSLLNISEPENKTGLDVTPSYVLTVQDMFQPIPGLISCADGDCYHMQIKSQVKACLAIHD